MLGGGCDGAWQLPGRISVMPAGHSPLASVGVPPRPGPWPASSAPPAAIVRNSVTTKGSFDIVPDIICGSVLDPGDPPGRRPSGRGAPGPRPGPRARRSRGRAATTAGRSGGALRPAGRRLRGGRQDLAAAGRGHPAGRRLAVRSLEDLHGRSARLHGDQPRHRFLPDRRPDPVRRSPGDPLQAAAGRPARRAATTSTAARRRSSCSPTRRR